VVVHAEGGGFDLVWIANDFLLRSVPVIVAAMSASTGTVELASGF